MPVTCVVKSCPKSAAADMKGLCVKCYSQAKKLVSAGETTWEELAEAGLCEQPETPFSKAFKQFKEQHD